MHPLSFSAFSRLLIFVTLTLLTLTWTGSLAHAGFSRPGAVYVLTNEADANRVMVFERATNGQLTYLDTVDSGGKGSGELLDSQGALALSQNGQFLFVVNAGSHDISSFGLQEDGVVLIDTVSSGGEMPISLTVHQDLLYVLNAGGNGNISGFRIEVDGGLTPLSGSTRALSGSDTAPAQVSFSPAGDILVVTEKATNRIDVYPVDSDGKAIGPVIHDSSGQTPFGFAFAFPDRLIVSEAFGGADGASAASSYLVSPDGGLELVSGSIPNHQSAACWTVVTRNSRYAYISNAGSMSITGYRIGEDGSLSMLSDDGISALVLGAPLDMALSENSRYLYVMNAATHRLDGFRVQRNGKLKPIVLLEPMSLPVSAEGIAAR